MKKFPPPEVNAQHDPQQRVHGGRQEFFKNLHPAGYSEGCPGFRKKSTSVSRASPAWTHLDTTTGGQNSSSVCVYPNNLRFGEQPASRQPAHRHGLRSQQGSGDGLIRRRGSPSERTARVRPQPPGALRAIVDVLRLIDRNTEPKTQLCQPNSPKLPSVLKD